MLLRDDFFFQNRVSNTLQSSKEPASFSTSEMRKTRPYKNNDEL